MDAIKLSDCKELMNNFSLKDNPTINLKNVLVCDTHIVVWHNAEGIKWYNRICNEYERIQLPQCNINLKNDVKYHNYSFPEEALYFYIKKNYPNAKSRVKKILLNKSLELDIFIPELRTAIEYDGKIFHASQTGNPINIEKDIKKYEECKALNIKLIRVREDNSIEEELLADKVFYKKTRSFKSLEKCIKDVLYELSPSNKIDMNINLKRDEFIIKKKFYKKVIANSLLVKKPEIAAEWDYALNDNYRPEKIFVNSEIRVNWICRNCGAMYKEKVSNKFYSKPGCRACRISQYPLINGRCEQIEQWTINNQYIATYKSIKQAAVANNINEYVLTKCADNNTPYNGYIWKKHKKENALRKIVQKDMSGNVIKVWDNIISAAKTLNINVNQIPRACKGNIPSYKGFIWEYGEKIAKSRRIGIGKGKPVFQCALDGKIIKKYDSMILAAQSQGVKTSEFIRRVCVGERKSFHGYKWKYADTKELSFNNSNMKKILQYDIDGNFIKQYDNLEETIKLTKIKRAYLKTVLKGDRKTTSGYYFIYEDDHM